MLFFSTDIEICEENSVQNDDNRSLNQQSAIDGKTFFSSTSRLAAEFFWC